MQRRGAPHTVVYFGVLDALRTTRATLHAQDTAQKDQRQTNVGAVSGRVQAGEKETHVGGQVIIRVYQERIALEKRFRKYRESWYGKAHQ